MILALGVGRLVVVVVGGRAVGQRRRRLEGQAVLVTHGVGDVFVSNGGLGRNKKSFGRSLARFDLWQLEGNNFGFYK
jgi:hypothetical protein